MRASVPALFEQGVSITQAMCRRLFRDLEIRMLFNDANQGEEGRQVNALAVAVLAYARNIKNLGVLLPAVERFGGRNGVAPMKRNYSISSAPNGVGYRISVKREAEGQGGSRHLHDYVQVGDMIEATGPAGDFFLNSESSRPVVLLSGGVGLTPMVNMLETIAASELGREAHFVHGALNGLSTPWRMSEASPSATAAFRSRRFTARPERTTSSEPATTRKDLSRPTG